MCNEENEPPVKIILNLYSDCRASIHHYEQMISTYDSILIAYFVIVAGLLFLGKASWPDIDNNPILCILIACVPVIGFIMFMVEYQIMEKIFLELKTLLTCEKQLKNNGFSSYATLGENISSVDNYRVSSAKNKLGNSRYSRSFISSFPYSAGLLLLIVEICGLLFLITQSGKWWSYVIVAGALLAYILFFIIPGIVYLKNGVSVAAQKAADNRLIEETEKEA